MILPVNNQGNTSFIEWVNNSLNIAPHPALKKESLENTYDYDIVINVSDLLDFRTQEKITARNIQAYWLPLGESFGLPLENIYGAMTVLWHAEKHNKKVFLHCMAGRNRSITVADCYYFLRTGEHRSDNDKQLAYAKNKSNQLLLNIQDNQLPGIFRMELFLEKCKELLSTPSIANDAYVDWIKKNTLYY